MKKMVFGLLMISLAIGSTASCNHNKIACPAYADSAPQKKSQGKPKPELPKNSKPRSGVLPPGYGR